MEKVRDDHEARNQLKSTIENEKVDFVITARIEDEDFVFDRYPSEKFCKMIEQ